MQSSRWKLDAANLLLCFVCAGPTMKLRRPIVVKMYEEKINEMYAAAKQ